MTTDRQELIDGIRKRHEAVERKTPGVAPCLEPQIHADRATLLELLSGSGVGNGEWVTSEQVVQACTELGLYPSVDACERILRVIDHLGLRASSPAPTHQPGPPMSREPTEEGEPTEEDEPTEAMKIAEASHAKFLAKHQPALPTKLPSKSALVEMIADEVWCESDGNVCGIGLAADAVLTHLRRISGDQP